MGKTEKYTLPKNSNTFYHEKVSTLQKQIYKKIKTVAKFLDTLIPKSSNDLNLDDKNYETLMNNLHLMQKGFHENQFSFETKKLKTNLKHIADMKKICDTLQSVKSYEHEVKQLGKIKHALNELEHLIHHNSAMLPSEALKKPTKKATKSKEHKKTPKAKAKPAAKKTAKAEAKPAVKKTPKAKAKPAVKKTTKAKAKPAAKKTAKATAKATA